MKSTREQVVKALKTYAKNCRTGKGGFGKDETHSRDYHQFMAALYTIITEAETDLDEYWEPNGEEKK